MSSPLSLLVSQNRSYDKQVLEQAQLIFEMISKAILTDNNYVSIDFEIYPINICILQNKGYYIQNQKIIWGDFKTKNVRESESL